MSKNFSLKCRNDKFLKICGFKSVFDYKQNISVIWSQFLWQVNYQDTDTRM